MIVYNLHPVLFIPKLIAAQKLHMNMLYKTVNDTHSLYHSRIVMNGENK